MLSRHKTRAPEEKEKFSAQEPGIDGDVLFAAERTGIRALAYFKKMHVTHISQKNHPPQARTFCRRTSFNHQPPTTTPSITMAAEKKERSGLITGLNKGHV
jgi:hypothetical protein